MDYDTKWLLIMFEIFIFLFYIFGTLIEYIGSEYGYPLGILLGFGIMYLGAYADDHRPNNNGGDK